MVPSTDILPDTVVAKVAGISVTVADVRKMLEFAPQNVTQQFKTNPQQAIAGYYALRYLSDEAAKLGLDKVSPYKEQFEALYDLLKEEILANAMVNQLHDGYNVSAEQIDDFYAKNQSRWEEAKIKVILISFKPTPVGGVKSGESTESAIEDAAKRAIEGAHTKNERTEEDAQKLASDLVRQLRGGADFAKLVAQYSDDAESKASGGDFGTSIKANGSFAPELKKAVFAMKQGEISDPVRQGNGFYIIRLEDKTVQPINDVRGEIVMELRNNHRDQYMSDVDKRFTPQVVRPEFFVQPERYLAQVPPPAGSTSTAPAPPAQSTSVK